MDLDAIPPIVGVHNNCGGDIVLQMAVSDTVQLAGFGLDGGYIVTGDRDAFADDVAPEAKEGPVAEVVLQTCYYSADGRERPIARTRA